MTNVVTMDEPGSLLTTVQVGPGVDMSNGIDIEFLGPNGETDEFSYNCDSGEFALTYDPDSFPPGDY